MMTIVVTVLVTLAVGTGLGYFVHAMASAARRINGAVIIGARAWRL